jgi:cytoskeletal protein CcmA (bactofilin family)
MFTEKQKGGKEDLSKEQNKIAQGTSYNGDITSEGSFRVEGKVEGSIKTSGKVVIGKTGEVEGEITCENADIEGAFKGDISVNATLALRATANVNGKANIDKLSVEPGAVFNATCTMKGAVKDLGSDSKRSKGEKTKEGQTA